MTDARAPVYPISWLWIAAIWTAGGLFDASQTVLIARAEGHHNAALLSLFVIELVSWLPWPLATPFIISLARRYPILPGFNGRAVAIHFAAVVIITAVAEAWSAELQVLFDPWGHRKPPTFVDTWTTNLLYQALIFLIAYALILTLTYVVDARARIQRQTVEAAQLNDELSRAQLAALRRQIEPHFVYNALNAIAGLVRDRRNDAAVDMIVGLSEFLRRASDDSHRAQVTLAEEVEYLKRYLDIQKVRFGERLRISLDIPAELLDAKVPNLLLQPLVENAIKHGISKRVAGGAVHIAGATQDGALSLSVYNDGPCSREDLDATRTGVGIGNLRTRLKILHGDRSGLRLQRADADGFEVVVTLPLQEA